MRRPRGFAWSLASGDLTTYREDRCRVLTRMKLSDPRLCLTVVVLLLSLAACGPRQPAATGDTLGRGYVLPRLDVPDDTLLLFEDMVMKDADRAPNWRYRFDVRGCYYSARNTQLTITEPAQFESDDPALTWDTPFSGEPDRCLNEAQFAELMDAIRATAFVDLNPIYTSVAFPFTSSPRVGRWTLVEDGVATTVVAEQEAIPLRLMDLQTVVSRLVAEAPPWVSP